MFERLAIDWMLSASQSAVAERLGLSWDEMHGIQKSAVKRGLGRREAELVERIGVDEKAFTPGTSLLHSGQRSRQSARSVCERGTHDRQPERVLDLADAQTTGRCESCLYGYVGPVLPFHRRSSARRARQDRLR